MPNGTADLSAIRDDGRVLDIAFAVVGLLSTLPILVISCAAILLWDGWPIFHFRQVLGLGGAEFKAFKLRTMRLDADEWLNNQPNLLNRYREHTKLEDDPRVTPVGRILRRLHIDELPQLVNVLLGQMSMVGPRMIHPTELQRYGDFARRRISVRPGLTGPWQISKGRSYDYKLRIELDQWYLEHRSTRLDLWLLVRTVPAVFGRRVDFGPMLSNAAFPADRG